MQQFFCDNPKCWLHLPMPLNPKQASDFQKNMLYGIPKELLQGVKQAEQLLSYEKPYFNPDSDCATAQVKVEMGPLALTLHTLSLVSDKKKYVVEGVEISGRFCAGCKSLLEMFGIDEKLEGMAEGDENFSTIPLDKSEQELAAETSIKIYKTPSGKQKTYPTYKGEKEIPSKQPKNPKNPSEPELADFLKMADVMGPPGPSSAVEELYEAIKKLKMATSQDQLVKNEMQKFKVKIAKVHPSKEDSVEIVPKHGIEIGPKGVLEMFLLPQKGKK